MSNRSPIGRLVAKNKKTGESIQFATLWPREDAEGQMDVSLGLSRKGDRGWENTPAKVVAEDGTELTFGRDGDYYLNTYLNDHEVVSTDGGNF